MRQLYAPNGNKIVGTSDLVPGTANVSGWNDDDTPVWEGRTTMHWDDQKTRVNEAGVIYVVDEDGEHHLFSDCVFRDDDVDESDACLGESSCER
ncbi:hypothetical protein KDW82_09235 [Burkholderia vietnamiensis]|uniref:hypothetical protein n=1 Tax=Burkholderia vietnamiensis TaxID=60552 RepID=UPI001B99A382|nr:hypothetical protein [Burkholderia vietnamiensis]MBR8189244.1 hypothetical protein [Burkholderia vietnamiensis]